PTSPALVVMAFPSVRFVATGHFQACEGPVCRPAFRTIQGTRPVDTDSGHAISTVLYLRQMLAATYRMRDSSDKRQTGGGSDSRSGRPASQNLAVTRGGRSPAVNGPRCIRLRTSHRESGLRPGTPEPRGGRTGTPMGGSAPRCPDL